MNTRSFSLVLLSALACATVANAQSSSTSGAVRGAITSKGGGRLVGATVTIRNVATNLTRTQVTAANGEYTFALLPLGTYEITVTAPGMRTLKDTSTRVSLGATSIANFSLDRAEAGATVAVVAAAAALDAQQVTSTVALNSKMVESIPLAARDFTSLARLTPGATTAADQNRLSVEGGRGIFNNLTIDGASYNSNFFGEQRGSTRIPFAFGIDTIKELQIITDAYDAQYGNAAGGVINAVSKTGTNEFTGSVLVQMRPKSLVARIKPAPAATALQNSVGARTKDFEQLDWNFNLGGPIVKDKLFFFAGLEVFHYTEKFTPSFGLDSGNNSQANLNTFLGKFGNIQVGNDGRTLAQENGYQYENDKRNTVAFARLDYNLNESHRFTLRVNIQNWNSENGTTDFTSSSAPITGQTQQGLEKDNGLSWVAEWNAIFSPRLVNEARLQIATERRPRYANSTASPEISITNGFNAGQNNFLPNGLDEFSKQLIDNLTYTDGDFTVKAGVDLQWFSFANTFYRYNMGAFSFGSYAVANRWANGGLLATDSFTYRQALSNYGGTISYDSSLYAGYVQASYSGLLNRRLTLALGVRYTGEHQPNNPRPNAQLAGLDQANDARALDPRFGFTYDLTGKGKTMLRGGAGYFSSPNPSLTVSNTMNSNGNTTSTYTLTASSAAVRTAANSGALSYAALVSGGGTRLSALSPATLTALGSASKDGQVWDPENKLPRAKRASLGIEHELDNGLVLGVRASYADFENLQYFVNINLRQRLADGSPDPNGYWKDGYPTKWNLFTSSGRPGMAIVRGRMLDFTGFGNIWLSENQGVGHYKAISITASKQSDSGFGFQSSLTFASSKDSNSNERVTASASANSTVNNPADPHASYGPSDNDVKFRGVFAGYFPVAFGIKGAAIATYTSGQPYTAYMTSDLNGDTSTTNDFAVGVTGRNTFRQPSVKTFDLRFTRAFNLPRKMMIELQADIFNVFNWANWTTSNTQYTNANFGTLNIQDRNTREVQLGARFKF